MANTTTLNETLRSPIDGTEFIRLATSGANWKAQLGTQAWIFQSVYGGNGTGSTLTLGSTTGVGATDSIVFNTGSQVQAMGIDTSQRVIISNNSFTEFNLSPVFSRLQLIGTDSSSSFLTGLWSTSGTASNGYNCYKSANATQGSRTAVVSGESLGYLSWYAAITGSADGIFAQILAKCDGTPSATSAPGQITLNTTASGATAVSERVRIDSNGIVVVGGAAAQTVEGATPQVQNLGTTAASSNVCTIRYSADTGGSFFTMAKSRGASIGTNTVVQQNDNVGGFEFAGCDGSGFQEAAFFSAAIDGATISATSMPGRMQFWTTPSGTHNAVERLRIDNTGLASFWIAFGYGLAGNGTGGTITQLTSRTTGVTLSNICGAITLFAAAPTVGTWVTFTVTNTTVVATDTVIVNFKSATNTYVALVSAVAAGSFNITFQSVAGTASDSPVINFAVIKAVTT